MNINIPNEVQSQASTLYPTSPVVETSSPQPYPYPNVPFGYPSPYWSNPSFYHPVLLDPAQQAQSIQLSQTTRQSTKHPEERMSVDWFKMPRGKCKCNDCPKYERSRTATDCLNCKHTVELHPLVFFSLLILIKVERAWKV